jgi:hypothetical protein
VKHRQTEFWFDRSAGEGPRGSSLREVHSSVDTFHAWDDFEGVASQWVEISEATPAHRLTGARAQMREDSERVLDILRGGRVNDTAKHTTYETRFNACTTERRRCS